MPEIRRISTDTFQLLVWRIDEPLAFFAKELQFNKEEMEEYGNISYEARKLEWLAARYAQRQLYQASLTKDSWGKPHLDRGDGYISLAHCTGYAAAIYSPNTSVGIDIEPIHDKVQRIATKFLNEKELAFIDESNITEHYISAWSIKESVYKWYGKKKLSFKQNIQIDPFSLHEGQANVLFKAENQHENRKVYFEKIHHAVLAYTS